jgi:hypothetical protein
MPGGARVRGSKPSRGRIAVLAVVVSVGVLAAGLTPSSGSAAANSHFPIGISHVGFGVASNPNDDVKGAQLIADLEDISAAGFTLVQAMPDETDQGPFLTRADQLGMNVIYSKDGTDGDWVDVLPSMVSHPSLVGLSTGDDVNGREAGGYHYPLAQAKADYDARKQQAPNEAVYLSGGGHQSYGNLKLWAPYADIIGVQSYPVCNEPVAKVLTEHWAYMQRAFTRLSKIGQPWYLNGQAFAWGGACANTVPTLTEYRNMMFAGLANGASGILNYTYFDAAGRLPQIHPQLWTTIKSFNANIRSIEQFLLSGQLTRLTALKQQVHGAYWKLGNEVLLVVLNTNRTRTRPAKLTLPAGFTGPLVPAFTGYPVGLTNNARTVTGSIGPDAVQVYRVSL